MTELGNRLREAREAKGLSLEDLQEITKIQKRYLKGIEEGNYAPMPGNFYVRAFIKQYAEAVGLEPEEIFNVYANEIPASHHEDLPEQLSRVQTRKTVSPQDSKVFVILPKLLVGLFVIGAVFAIWYIVQSVASEDQGERVSQNENAPEENAGVNNDLVEEEPADEGNGDETGEDEDNEEPAESEEPAEPEPVLENVGVSGTTASYALKNAEQLTVEVSSTGRTWIQVTGADNTVYFADELTEGNTISYNMTQNSPVKIIVGFAPDTQISVNGIPLEYQIPADDTVTQNIIIQFEGTSEQ
ncbi:cytoskeletal protein RodZ [Bacillus oleivorans]|uniref:Cytoskeletal protein RodZ n=1 Tax=Bacillus oleivorans TaxID=1448271 RepID=A0A285D6E2_9BACI|nr:RodZ domain-containing protein [Bacillus oleivorans]SNX75369.1 cytoskeletal protein RodZ [Bacillus oleivorans]